MFLRAKCRKKDGKVHRYWTVVENRRTSGGRVAQRDVLYLGELNDAQHAGWVRMIETFCIRDKSRSQMALFPQDCEPAKDLKCEVVQVCLDRMELRHPRQWGGCWLAMHLWDLLELDRFWGPKLPPSREGTRWLHVLKSLVAYRLVDPGSEYRFHREWFVHSAMADLLGETFALASRNNPYRCLDQLVEHKDGLFGFLKQRWSELFGATYDIVLYDLTSTYFECDPPDPDQDSKKAHGYSRDHRPDCVQVVVALVITPEGLPLSYEVLKGNTADNTTLEPFLDSIEAKYGKARRTWLMDRGIPTEDSLKKMRERGAVYLVGTPKGRLTKLEKQLVTQAWSKARQSVRVKLIQVELPTEPAEPSQESGDRSGQLHSVAQNNPTADSGRVPESKATVEGGQKHPDKELYIFVESADRVIKERSMRRRRLKRLWKRLKEFGTRKKIQHDELLMSLGAARKDAGRAWRLVRVSVGKPDPTGQCSFSFELDRKKLREARRREGRYLLRSNMTSDNPAMLWEQYMLLVNIEQAFKDMKHDLSIRPIWHQLEDRIQAHILVSFLCYCLHVTLRNLARNVAGGLTPAAIIEKLCSIQMIDVHLPTTDNRHIVLSRYTQPEKDVALLLAQMQLQLPGQSPPKISSEGDVSM